MIPQALLPLLLVAAFDTVSLEARLSTDSLYLDQTLTATYTVTAEGDAPLYEPIESLALQDLQVVGAQHSRGREKRNGASATTDVFTFTLKPLAIGMCHVQPFRLAFRAAGETEPAFLLTPPLGVLVQRRPQPSRAGWWLAGGLLLVAGMATGVLALRRRRVLPVAVDDDQHAALARQAIGRMSELRLDASAESGRALFSVFRDYLREVEGAEALPTAAAAREWLRNRGVTGLDEPLATLDRALFGQGVSVAELESVRMKLKNHMREQSKGGSHES